MRRNNNASRTGQVIGRLLLTQVLWPSPPSLSTSPRSLFLSLFLGSSCIQLCSLLSSQPVLCLVWWELCLLDEEEEEESLMRNGNDLFTLFFEDGNYFPLFFWKWSKILDSSRPFFFSLVQHQRCLYHPYRDTRWLGYTHWFNRHTSFYYDYCLAYSYISIALHTISMVTVTCSVLRFNVAAPRPSCIVRCTRGEKGKTSLSSTQHG